MGKQTKMNRTATLWKWGTKWNGDLGWCFVGCHAVQPRLRGNPLPLDSVVSRLKSAFGISKHRGARMQRFKAKMRHRAGHRG